MTSTDQQQLANIRNYILNNMESDLNQIKVADLPLSVRIGIEKAKTRIQDLRHINQLGTQS